jgi:hypothetical protein
MVLDHALVAAGHKDEVLDAGLARLVDHVLDQRAIDDGQHLFRHGLGGRQEPGAQAGNRENSFADRFHACVRDSIANRDGGDLSRYCRSLDV